MVETGENKEIKKEIQEQTTSQNQDKKDINFLIQEKCTKIWLNWEKIDKVQIFFNNINKSLTKTHEETFKSYIKNLNKNDFLKISFLNDSKLDQEAKKIKKNILEQIDSESNEPLITTYNKTEEEQNKTEEIEKQFQELKSNYDKLPPNLKPTQEQIDQQKKYLDENGTLNELKDKWLSEDQINDYVSFNYTYTNHQEAIQNTDFAKSYEKLENKLFPKTRSFTPKLLKSENATSYQDEIIKSNPKINNYVQQINWWSSNYQEKSKEIEKLNNNEIKEEFDKEKNQELFNKYKTLLPQEPKEDENKTTEENLQEKTKRQRNILLEINSLEEQTQSTIQKRVFGSTISWLTSFFDFSTWQKENLSVIASDSVAINTFSLT